MSLIAIIVAFSGDATGANVTPPPVPDKTVTYNNETITYNNEPVTYE